MADPTDEFFNQISGCRPEWLSDKARVTMRFDLERDGQVDHWFVTLAGGTVRVSREEHEADMVFHAQKGLFDRIASGEQNAVAATFRNELHVSGKYHLYAFFRQLTPGHPRAIDPGAVARERRRRR